MCIMTLGLHGSTCTRTPGLNAHHVRGLQLYDDAMTTRLYLLMGRCVGNGQPGAGSAPSWSSPSCVPNGDGALMAASSWSRACLVSTGVGASWPSGEICTGPSGRRLPGVLLPGRDGPGRDQDSAAQEDLATQRHSRRDTLTMESLYASPRRPYRARPARPPCQDRAAHPQSPMAPHCTAPPSQLTTRSVVVGCGRAVGGRVPRAGPQGRSPGMEMSKRACP